MAGSSPVKSDGSAEHEDLTEVSTMKSVGIPGGGAATTTVEKVKEIGGLVSTGIDAVEQIKSTSGSSAAPAADTNKTENFDGPKGGGDGHIEYTIIRPQGDTTKSKVQNGK